MKFAILADIHGNSATLKAVLDDMVKLGITEAVNLGDHVSGPLDAAGTLELLAQRQFPSIKGNHDRWVVEKDVADMGPSDEVAFKQLDKTQLSWLADLPATRTAFDDVFLCHGTPHSDLDYWLERVEPNGMMRQATLDEIEREAEDISASLILCAHTHTPRLVRLSDGRTILNPGSIGCPAYDDDVPVFHKVQTGSPNASYAIAERTEDDWLITFRSVPYDASAMINLALSHGREDWAHALKTGWMK